MAALYRCKTEQNLSKEYFAWLLKQGYYLIQVTANSGCIVLCTQFHFYLRIMIQKTTLSILSFQHVYYRNTRMCYFVCLAQCVTSQIFSSVGCTWKIFFILLLKNHKILLQVAMLISFPLYFVFFNLGHLKNWKYWITCLKICEHFNWLPNGVSM